MSNPQLLKARQKHSRIFAAVLILVLFVTQPMLARGFFLRELLMWIGYALVIFGAFGRVYCSTFIGGRKNDEVVRVGVFSVVRNPLYVFSFIATVGIGMQSGSLLVLIALAGAFILYYPLVVDREEEFLTEKFGEQYEKYMEEVPRWIPDMKLWNEPEQIDAKPKFIRQTMQDAFIFFLPMPAFALINSMQVAKTLPVLFAIP